MGRSCYCCDKTGEGPCDLCPNLLEDSSIKKATISIKGFQDYNFDETYFNEFVNFPYWPSIESIGLNDNHPDRYYPHSAFKGTASFRYFINILGLDQLNTSSEFDLINNKFIPKEPSKFLGEVSVTVFVEHSASGKGYAFFPFPFSTACKEPCTILEPCQTPTCPYRIGPIRKSEWHVMYESEIPSDWNGKLGVEYKYDFYLVSEEYSCDLGMTDDPETVNLCEGYYFSLDGRRLWPNHPFHMIFRNGDEELSTTPPVRLVALLKETSIIEDGIYKNAGYYKELESFNTCYSNTSNNCPPLGQSPCSGLVIKAKKECRNPLYFYSGIVSSQFGPFNYQLHHDISEKIFFPYGCEDGRCHSQIICSCEGYGVPPPPNSCPPSGQAYKYWHKCRAFESHYNFYPFGAGVIGLLHDERKIPINEYNCNTGLFNLIKNYNFTGKYNFKYFDPRYTIGSGCYPVYDDPCLFCNSYNDAAKKISQKYQVATDPSYLTFSENETVDFVNNTNYLKIFHPCDSKEWNNCNFSNTLGVGVLRSPSQSYEEINYNNFLDFIFSKILTMDGSDYRAFSNIWREYDNNSKCFNYNVNIPAPKLHDGSFLNALWGASEIEFTKFKDSEFFGTKTEFYPYPDSIYCNKTFATHPNLNWTSTGKNSDNEIIVAAKLKSVTIERPYFTLPNVPETILEVEYE